MPYTKQSKFGCYATSKTAHKMQFYLILHRSTFLINLENMCWFVQLHPMYWNAVKVIYLTAGCAWSLIKFTRGMGLSEYCSTFLDFWKTYLNEWMNEEWIYWAGCHWSQDYNIVICVYVLQKSMNEQLSCRLLAINFQLLNENCTLELGGFFYVYVWEVDFL